MDRLKFMTTEEYILLVKGKNPRLFAASLIRIAPASLEKVVRQAFNAGQESARKEKSLFKQIFG